MTLLLIQTVLLRLFLHAVQFPVWWYSRGLIYIAQQLQSFVGQANATLGPGLWLKHIFVPMFGQRDLQGRLMSIFMRVVNIVIRSIALLVVTLFSLLLGVLWIVFPLMVLSATISSLVILFV